MNETVSRRLVLRTSLGLAVAAGIGAGGIAGAGPAGADPEYPPVPGMLGDRKANEFWYQFNVATLFERPPELDAAFEAIAEHLEAHGKQDLVSVWQEMVEADEYPHNYSSFVRPVAEPLGITSRIQLEVFDRFYRRRSPELVKAFALYGQGVLYDPRQPPEPPVHAMNHLGAYRAWHVYLRAMMMAGIDRVRWREIAPLNAFAWAVQAEAQPGLEHVNPPLPAGTVARLAVSWLPRGVERLDRDFQSSAAPADS